VRAYALCELGDSRAVDVHVRREDALRALEEAIKDEPDWAGVRFIAPIELDERDVSANESLTLGIARGILMPCAAAGRIPAP
jgi:hypothetical protein